MTDFLDEKKREMQVRRDELRPLVDEFHRLEAAIAALDGVAASPRSSSPRPARASRPSGGEDSGRRGRPRGTGTRSKEALAIVRERPGVTIPELADAMGIKQNYLYRVMPELQKDGLVRKEGRGWHALDAA